MPNCFFVSRGTMSLHDQKTFLSSIHPFDLLSENETIKCIYEMDIAYYPKGTVLIDPENLQKYFFIIIKGEVREFSDDEILTEYHSMDSFDADSLMYSKTNNSFIVSEDLICYQLTKKGFLSLLDSNQKFKNFYLNNLSQKIQTLKQKKYSSEFSTFMVARVNEGYLHEPCVVKSDATLLEGIQKSIELKSSSIIVEKDGKYGIITDSDLKSKVLFNGCDLQEKVSDFARFPFICVNDDDFLFNALLTLTKHSIKRVGVMKEGKLVGVLEQIDLLSYFANQSHLASVKIKRAKTIEDLKTASSDLLNIIKALSAKGVKVNYIAKLIAELNVKIYEKLFQMTIPEDLADKCALVVMGSEGRAEQIIKTDQDNALIIKNGINKEEYYPYMQRFSETLIDFGFPKCEGNIMVSNPYWCKNFGEYKEELATWVENPDMDSYMNLSIFFDSCFAAGDETLLKELKKELFKGVENKDVFMAYFAKLALSFETPIGVFSGFMSRKNRVDIKKGGIFPIVQGIRALSLKNSIEAPSTVKRIKQLSKKGVLEKDLADELLEAFDALGTIRLKNQLKNISAGEKADNILQTDHLGKLERDLLKDSFRIVDRFKKFITRHFKLDMIS